jgi:hypothetical protein
MNGQVPDPRQTAINSQMLEAQKDWAQLQLAQQVRQQKVSLAINFLSLRHVASGGDGKQSVHHDTPITSDEQNARASAFAFLEVYFGSDTPLESGQPLREEAIPHGVALA